MADAIEIVERQLPRKKNVQKKTVEVKRPIGKVGEVAHYHRKENATEIWDEACLFVEHKIRDKVGFRVGPFKYKGNVIVPTCVSNYLAGMETNFRKRERNIFRNGGRTRVIGAY